MQLTNKHIQSFYPRPTIPSFISSHCLNMCSSRLKTVRFPANPRKDLKHSHADNYPASAESRKGSPGPATTASNTRAALCRHCEQWAEHHRLWIGVEELGGVNTRACGRCWPAQDAVDITRQVFPSRCFTQSHPSS